MVEESDIYLEGKDKDKGKWYYSRKLISRFRKLGLEVPRVRSEEFQPFLGGCQEFFFPLFV